MSIADCGVLDMQRISKRKLASYPRPLQGGVGVIRSGGGSTLGGAYQAALDKANAANEARYRGIISGYDDLANRVEGRLQGVGEQEYRDIDRTYKSMGSDVYQRLVNRGFANSTLPATQQMGVERERSGARSRLASDLAQQRANYDMNIAQGKFGVMERRNDIAPDPAMLARLSEGLGQGGYGGGPMQIGQPIGIHPSQYQMAYQQALGNHMAFMPRQPYRPTQRAMDRMSASKSWWAYKNALKAQQRAGRQAPPLMMPGQQSFGPFRAGYQYPPTV